MKRLTLLAVAVIGLCTASVSLGQDKKNDEKLQGTWTVTGAEREGKTLEKVHGDKLVLSGRNFTIKAHDTEMKGTFTVDATANPKVIDFKHTDGPHKDLTMEGIYTIEGDNLKLCVTEPGSKQRPSDFTTKGSVRQMLITFKKDKP